MVVTLILMCHHVLEIRNHISCRDIIGTGRDCGLMHVKCNAKGGLYSLNNQIRDRCIEISSVTSGSRFHIFFMTTNGREVFYHDFLIIYKTPQALNYLYLNKKYYSIVFRPPAFVNRHMFSPGIISFLAPLLRFAPEKFGSFPKELKVFRGFKRSRACTPLAYASEMVKNQKE